MASKRSTASDTLAAAGSALARAKRAVTRKPQSRAATETQAAAASGVSQPTFEEIARLAYSYWEARGYQGGSPEEDWLRAEMELRSKPIAASATA